MTRGELRAEAIERDGQWCRFPECELTRAANPLEMAHLKGAGSGGSKYRDHIDNVVMLCKFHHDWLDGRLNKGRRFENEIILREVTGIRWEEPR